MSQFPPPIMRLYKAPSSRAFSAMTPLPIYSLLQKEFKKAAFTRPAHFFVIENVMFCDDTSTVFGLAHSLEEANRHTRTDTAATFYIKGVLHVTKDKDDKIIRISKSNPYNNMVFGSPAFRHAVREKRISPFPIHKRHFTFKDLFGMCPMMEVVANLDD